MSTMLIQSGTLDDIADAIRAKTGGSASMTPLQMPTEIANIPSGGEDGVIVVYVDTSPNFVANQLFTYTAPKTGKCSVSYYTVMRQTGATVKVNDGSSITPTYSRNVPSGSLNFGYYFYEFNVVKNDTITVQLNYQGGSNNNHREFIVAVVEDVV